MNFQRVLFPVDLSDQSRRVAPFVKALATRHGSEVLMLHVIHIDPVMPADPALAVPTVVPNVEDLRRQRRAVLESFLQEELAGVAVVREIVEGDTAPEIVKQAESQQVDLIMMATHGYGPFRLLLLGSVTARVLHDADCPVWTAVHTIEPVADPSNGWRRILCATNATAEDSYVISSAAELARAEHAQLCVVYAISAVDAGAISPEPYLKFLVETAEGNLMKLLAKIEPEPSMSIQFGAPARAVRKVAAEWKADVVVIGRGLLQKPLGRLRSNAYAIIRESPCPVISLPGA
jgi:nucleotide-binding universal stress UspA family protein